MLKPRLCVCLACVPLLVAACSGVAVAGPLDFAQATDKIAHFHLAGAMTETPQEDPFGLLASQTTSLKDLLERLARARKDDSVKAVVLTISDMGMGVGQLEEMHDSLTKFKAVDKRRLGDRAVCRITVPEGFARQDWARSRDAADG